MRSKPTVRTLFVLAQLVACHPGAPTAVVPVPCGNGESLIRDQIFFGRGVPNGGEVSDSAWHEFLETEVTPRFPAGLTVFDASGQWRDGGGQVVRERTWLLILYHPASEASARSVTALINAYRQRFAQEAVLHDRGPACVTY